MSAAQPLALLLAVLAVPLVLAYLHRRRRVCAKVSSTILFRAIAGEATPRRRALAHPRHLVSLLLMVLALLAGVHAIADIRPEGEHPRDFVVVLDTSTSMGVQLPGRATRLEEAVDRLAETLDRLGPDDRVALVTAGADTTVRVGLTRDRARILDTARAQQPAWCGVPRDAESCAARAESALRIADSMCRRSSHGSILLLSDGVGLTVPSTRCSVRHIPVGRSGPNVGITALAVREADALGLAEVHLQLTATGPAREVEVELRVDENVVDVLSLDVPADGQVERLHRLELPPGDLVTARLRRTEQDVLAADDVAATPRRAGQRVSVLLVAKPRRSFVAEALRLHPRVDLTVIGPHDRPPELLPDLVVLETTYGAGSLPPAPRLAALGTAPEEVGLHERGRFAAPEIVRWSTDDPILRFVDLEGLTLPRARTVEATEGIRSLVDSDEGSLAVTTREGEREVFYLGFAPAESDLVLRVGFVNLMANLVEWATPSGTHELSSNVDGAGPALPAIESRIDPPSRLEGTVSGNLPARNAGWPLWQILVLVALTLVTIEWLLPWVAVRRGDKGGHAP